MMVYLYTIRKNDNQYNLKSRAFILAITILFISGFLNGNQEINSTFFLLLYPIASFSIRGPKEGILWSLFLLSNLIIIYLNISYLYNLYSFIFFCCAFFMVSYLLFWYRKYELKIFEHMHKVNELKEQLELKNEELKKIATIDKLTKIFNRVKLDSTLEEELNRTQRFGHKFSIVLIDVDHFKSVNDTYGHQVGDTILFEIANLLKYYTRDTDTLGRWGGEEFMLICPETDEKGVLKLAKTLQKTIEQNEFSIIKNKTASFGVTTYKNADTIESIIKRADDALYISKENGRNQVNQL